MSNKNKDDEIIAAIKTGKNSLALNQLYKIALPKIKRFVISNRGDEEEAKDIFQDAVMALFKTVRMGKYDESREVTGFLYFVSRNLWINRIKKKNFQIQITETEEWETEDTPLVFIIKEEKQSAIQSLMNRLGENCRELLRYILYDKLSLKEVAERMDMGSEGAAKTRHHRCKRKLAEMIMENQNLISLLKE